MNQRIEDPGFGTKYERQTKRVINKDGTFNVKRRGVDTGLRSLYQAVISMSASRFLLLVGAGYFILNAIFATAYFMTGIEFISGAESVNGWQDWLTCFYFSFQTFTTVGYGALAPKGGVMNTIAAIEALAGLLGFALMSGVLYGRFSKPKSKLAYSQNAVIAPFGEHKALMFRLANKRTNVLMQMQAQIILMMHDDMQAPHKRSFYNLDLQVSKVNFLPLTWTVVHPITPDSPMFNKSRADLLAAEAEVLILISGFDDTFNQTVHSRYSYTCDEVVPNAKFNPAFSSDSEGEIVLDLEKINDYTVLTNET
ncbi:MAG: ion channel [Flavobacteriales bacterium]|nr:ion channel [Flavobacteriales bacterium]MDG2245343.1 ion channel [Flavobacteriales bacterium]